MELDFLTDLVVVFAVGGAVVYALRAAKIPPIVGLLLAGAAMGPHGAHLVADVHRVETLAEIGVVLLLFTIGLEFSLARLLSMWKVIVGGGGGQVLLTIVLVGAVTVPFGVPWEQSVYWGFLVALSSTAIVLRLLSEQAELHTPAGRVSLGFLLFQDLCIVPMMLLTPFLAGQGEGLQALAFTLLKALGVVAVVVVAARFVIPALLSRVIATRSRELFLTLLLVLCLGTAWFTSLAGLSLALGAFLAGLAISESEYSHQAMAEAIPFRDAFGSLFFMSIGMLLDAGFVVEHWYLVGGVVLALISLKTLAAFVAVLVLGYPWRVCVRVGLGLAQIGEFAFVLSRAGTQLGLLEGQAYQTFLAASVLSMVATPALLAAGRHIVALGSRLDVRDHRATGTEADPEVALSGHVIIVGYGLNGQNLARTLVAAGIQYAILEMNPETVREAKGRGEPIHFGDCTRSAVLELVGVHHAKMLVVAISDASSTRQSVSLARSLNPELFILVRTRFVAEIEELSALGANEIIPEEFETSVEIFSRVLHRFEVPRNIILDQISKVRGGMYEMLRGAPRHSLVSKERLPQMQRVQVESLAITEHSPAVNATLADLNLRRETGVSVLAVSRAGQTHENPGADFQFKPGDVALVLGDREALDKALTLLDPRVAVS